MTITFEITEEDFEGHKRLDLFLSKKFPELSRSLIKKLFEDDQFQSSTALELKKMPKAGTKITYHPMPAKEVDIEAQNIPLDILFEDEYLIIVNKPAGMVTHPAPGNYDQTLVNAILYHCPDLKGIGNEKRPGIVHRLDKGTSGVMVIAKEQQSHQGLVNLFSKHDIERKYQALCLGAKLPQQKILNAPIGRSPHNRIKMQADVPNSKEAITHMKVVEYFDKISHLELTLETGRTHQIRVHLSQLLNAPILNDHTYGRIKEQGQLVSNKIKALIKDYEYPFLHAKILGFNHPITGEKLYFEQEPPVLFTQLLQQFRLENN